MSNSIAIGKLLVAAKACESLQHALTEGAVAAAKETERLIAEGFKNEKSPYGRKWPARKDKLPHPILDKSGRLKRSWSVKAQGKRILIRTYGVDYAKYHQSGTKRMPARRMVPEGKLPPKWAKLIGARVARALGVKLRKGGFR